MDPPVAAETVYAVTNRLDTAQERGVFEDSRYREVWELLDPHAINILDLNTIASGRYGRRPLIPSAPTRNLFRKRSIARRREEVGLEEGRPEPADQGLHRALSCRCSSTGPPAQGRPPLWTTMWSG